MKVFPESAGPASPAGPEYEPYTGGADGDDGDAALNLRRYASAIWRQRWLVVALSAMGLAAGAGMTFVVKPMFEAQASIQVPSTRGFGTATATRSAPLFEGRGWVELLQSFEVLDAVVRERRLYLELGALVDSSIFRGFELTERFTPGAYRMERTDGDRLKLMAEDGTLLDEAAIGDSLGRAVGFAWVPDVAGANNSVSFRVRTPRDAAVRLGREMGVQLTPEGALMRISLRSENPVTAAATINAVANRFVNVATLLKREKLSTVTGILQKQLDSARFELAAAEAALEQFKVNTITLPSDQGSAPIAPGLMETRDPVRQAFFQLRLDREDLARDQEAIRRAVSSPQDSARSLVVSLGTIRSVRESAELTSSLALLTQKRAEERQLRSAYSSSHPPLRQVEREIADLVERTIPEQVGALMRNLALRIGDLDQRIAASAREMQQIPVRTIEEARRTRDVEVSQLIYTELQSAYEQARLAELSAAPDVRLLDLAVPPTRPVRDQLLLIIAAGAMAGVGLGIAVALLRDRFDVRLRYPEQVTQELGLPILGAVPMLKSAARPTSDESDQMIEALRGTRMAMLYSHGIAGPFVTTVTSPGIGDGKSFVSMNLARSFAMSGRRTLLVDGDTRRGVQHRSLGVSRSPGLTDVLEGAVSARDAIQQVSDGGFDFLPCGTQRRVAPELLSSPAMSRLMMELRGEYQAIIVDSPPLGAGVDPLVLASITGTLVLVLRTGITDRDLAGARLGDVERLPIRVLGAVLNDVRTSEGSYRYYAYLPGYRAVDGPQEVPALPNSSEDLSSPAVAPRGSE